MNIIEAIKSGKRYRRKEEPVKILTINSARCGPTLKQSWYEAAPDTTHYVFLTRDVLADDWEVESEPVTITREEFDAAWSKIWPNDPQFDSERNLIAEELGL